MAIDVAAKAMKFFFRNWKGSTAMSGTFDMEYFVLAKILTQPRLPADGTNRAA